MWLARQQLHLFFFNQQLHLLQVSLHLTPLLTVF